MILLYNTGPIYPDECGCSKVSIDTWLSNTKCRTNIEQINNDLNQFKNVNFKTVFGKMAKLYSQHPHSTSVCHYVVKNNLVNTFQNIELMKIKLLLFKIKYYLHKLHF